ncbi:MAG: hypothetical protein NUW37_18455 [Planctomycetes bacterium]|nr:hypothetical protein [Planctomycetota bacterium]
MRKRDARPAMLPSTISVTRPPRSARFTGVGGATISITRIAGCSEIAIGNLALAFARDRIGALGSSTSTSVTMTRFCVEVELLSFSGIFDSTLSMYRASFSLRKPRSTATSRILLIWLHSSKLVRCISAHSSASADVISFAATAASAKR